MFCDQNSINFLKQGWILYNNTSQLLYCMVYMYKIYDYLVM